MHSFDERTLIFGCSLEALKAGDEARTAERPMDQKASRANHDDGERCGEIPASATVKKGIQAPGWVEQPLRSTLYASGMRLPGEYSLPHHNRLSRLSSFGRS